MILGFELLVNDNTHNQSNNDNQQQSNVYGWLEEGQNKNPYDIAKMAEINWADKTQDIVNPREIDHITSIPSPYARLHITESALIEAKKEECKFEYLPRGYRRAISHLLDTFELVYRHNATALDKIGITVTRHKYIADVNACPQFVEPLNLYRNNYGKDKFNAFYKIACNGNPLAYTSPFTVFFTPEDIPDDCQIALDPNSITDFDQTNWSGILFSQDESTWSGIESRTKEIQMFLYAFVKRFAGSKELYKELFDYITKRLGDNFADIGNADYFAQNYHEFITDGIAGIKINVDNPKYTDVELLPLGYDKFAFKNLVDLKKMDYSAIESSKSPEYKKEVTERTNIFGNIPDGQTPPNLQWITIHDLLEDDVFQIDTHIDSSKYLAIADNEAGGSFILPFKKRFFDLFDLYTGNNGMLISDISNWVKIEYKTSDSVTGESDEQLVVSLSLPTFTTKDNSVIRVSVSKTYDADHIHKIDIDFGIYPFLQVNEYNGTTQPDNFYRIMLYLSNSSKCDLDSFNVFHKERNENGVWSYNPIKNGQDKYHIQKHATFTEEMYPGIGDNLYYLSLESRYIKDNSISGWKDVRFDFVEAIIDGLTVLFVPRLEKRVLKPISKTCSVDLGTSNSYVAYDNGTKDMEFDGEITKPLIGKLCYQKEQQEGRTNYDFTQGGIHQYVEFLPTEFGTNAAHFPIQSVQLYQSSIIDQNVVNQKAMKDGAPFVSMFSMNIPFKYNEMGVRMVESSTIDNAITNFKWFSNIPGHLQAKNALILFVDQLCFMLRNKVVSDGCDPNYAKLIWTYPLSMTRLDVYKQIWQNAYKKYFGQETSNLVAFTESETPIAMSDSGDESETKYRIGIDIGGGTTDVIGYKREKDNESEDLIDVPMFSSSFSFAGNAMFGKLYGSKAEMKNDDNLWYKVLKNHLTEGADKQSSDKIKTKTVEINPDLKNITDIMDYFFSNQWKTDETTLRAEMEQSKYISFINLFHFCSIIWEVAQICKNRLGNNCPNDLCFSGNGSNLILLSVQDKVEREKALNDIVNFIFSTIYNKRTNIKISLLDEPKKATARGAIKLVKNKNYKSGNLKNCIRFNDKVFSVGDDGTNNSLTEKQTNETEVQSNDLMSEFSVKTDNTETEHENTNSSSSATDINPSFSTIGSYCDLISEDVGKFIDTFLDKIAKIKYAGGLGQGKLDQIKRDFLGYTPERKYNSDKMKEIIHSAQNLLELKNDDKDNSVLKDSVFLAVIARIEISFIKGFAKMITE